jgi:hypothetical protein
MPYQTKLNVGDIITVGTSKVHQLVVRSEHRDGGDMYWVDEIDVIKFDADHSQSNPKVTSYYFEGAPMRGVGKQIKDSDVKVWGTCKVTPIVTTRYEITKIKTYSNV